MFDSALVVVQALLAVGLLTVAVVVSILSRRVRRLAGQLAGERVQREQIQNDLQALLACSRELGDRLREQLQKQRALGEQVKHLRTDADQASPIEQAELLLEKGLSLEQISNLCQLSHGEAELLARWAKHRRAA